MADDKLTESTVPKALRAVCNVPTEEPSVVVVNVNAPVPEVAGDPTNESACSTIKFCSVLELINAPAPTMLA